jgi:hypothetical protein
MMMGSTTTKSDVKMDRIDLITSTYGDKHASRVVKNKLGGILI